MDEAGSFPHCYLGWETFPWVWIDLVGVTFNSGCFPGLRCYFLVAPGNVTVEKSLFLCTPQNDGNAKCRYSGGWDWESHAGRRQRRGCRPRPLVCGSQDSPWAALHAAGPQGQDTVLQIPGVPYTFISLLYSDKPIKLGIILI